MSRRTSEVISAVIGGIVLLPIISILSHVVDPVKDREYAYSAYLIWTAGIVVAAGSAWDMYATLQRVRDDVRIWKWVAVAGSFLPALCSVVAFELVTIVSISRQQPSGNGPTHDPYLLACFLLWLLMMASRILAKPWKSRVPASQPLPTVRDEGDHARIGFAATSVLIDDRDGAPRFILIRNTNISSAGIWLSPGGHFDTPGSDPVEALREKIRSEVGLGVELWFATAEADFAVFSTDQTRWINPPVFILEEFLPDGCGRQHTHHFDLIYICLAAKNDNTVTPKYPSAERISVDVSRCAISPDNAYGEVSSAVSRWEKDRQGYGKSVNASVYRDVTDRLHLVAKTFLLSKEQARILADER